MNILIGGEGRQQGFIPGKMRQQSQFNLRIVGAEDAIVLIRRYKRRADPAAQFGSNRDILQVRPAGAESPCRSYGLIEGSMHASGSRINQRAELIYIRGSQFIQHTVLKHQLDHGVLPG